MGSNSYESRRDDRDCFGAIVTLAGATGMDNCSGLWEREYLLKMVNDREEEQYREHRGRDEQSAATTCGRLETLERKGSTCNPNEKTKRQSYLRPHHFRWIHAPGSHSCSGLSPRRRSC